MSRIVELQNRQNELSNELVRVKQELYEERLKQSGITIGEVVVGTSGRHKGVYVKISKVEFDHYRSNWVSGAMQKKDGTFGRTVCLYGDWARLGPTPTKEQA